MYTPGEEPLEWISKGKCKEARRSSQTVFGEMFTLEERKEEEPMQERGSTRDRGTEKAQCHPAGVIRAHVLVTKVHQCISSS